MYGEDGAGNNGYDCVVIPGAIKKTNNPDMAPLPFSRICGSGKGLATGNNNANFNMPVCCKITFFFKTIPLTLSLICVNVTTNNNITYRYITRKSSNPQILFIHCIISPSHCFLAKQASPFHIRHMSDGFEFIQGGNEAMDQNKGFRLTYEMDCNA